MSESLMETNAKRRFNELWNDIAGTDTLILEYGGNHKYAIFSDLHMGDGSGSDNFRKNESIMIKALKYYKKNGYSIILAGDIEEYHQHSLPEILNKYTSNNPANPSVYDMFRSFNDKIFRIYGNHDIEWSLRDPIIKTDKRSAYEAIKLKRNGSTDIMITHGHQAQESIEKDIHVVRAGTVFYRELERFFKLKSKSILDEKPCKKDRIFSRWAENKKKILICAHTHCPTISKYFIDYKWVMTKYRKYDNDLIGLDPIIDRDKITLLKERKKWLHSKYTTYDGLLRKGKRISPVSPYYKFSKYYFNSGGCLYDDCITNIDINGDIIRSVIWFNKIENNKPENIIDGFDLNISSIV